MFDKFKYYFGAAFVLLAGLFMYERSKRKSAEAVVDNHNLLNDLDKGNKQIAENSGLLQAEEEKRKQLEKEAKERQQDDSGDTADFFNKHV